MKVLHGLLVVTGLLAGCGNGGGYGSVLQPLGLTLQTSGLGLHGTAPDDLWQHWVDGQRSQNDLWDNHVEYFDGEQVLDVSFPTAVFEEGICGSPGSLVAVTRGELWMGAVRNPQCGLDPEHVAGSRVMLGMLQADGTFVDHSADFPELAPGTYKDLTLDGRAGAIVVTVRTENDGATTVESYLYDSSGRRALAEPPGAGPFRLSVLGADDFVATNDSGSLHYMDGAWSEAPAGAVLTPNGSLATNEGETWAFAYGGVRQQVEQVAEWYTRGSFQPVPFNLARASDHASYIWQPIALVPRAGGEFTLVGVTSLYNESDETEMRLEARRFDGTELATTDEPLGPLWRCVGLNDDRCPIGPLEHFRSLADGSTLVRTLNDSVHPVEHFVLRAEDLP